MRLQLFVVSVICNIITHINFHRYHRYYNLSILRVSDKLDAIASNCNCVERKFQFTIIPTGAASINCREFFVVASIENGIPRVENYRSLNFELWNAILGLKRVSYSNWHAIACLCLGIQEAFEIESERKKNAAFHSIVITIFVVVVVINAMDVILRSFVYICICIQFQLAHCIILILILHRCYGISFSIRFQSNDHIIIKIHLIELI